MPYLIPASEARAEIEVLHSRFIATAAPAFTAEGARAFVARIRGEFPGASHHVSAYLIGHGSSVTAHAHDDGEPPGTAGRPALAVLQGSDLGDVAVVVTRYFGGTKLGTGGLVRAYGDAVRAVLDVLPRAMHLPVHTVSIETSYPLFERVRLAIESHRGQILEQEFGLGVRVLARFTVARLPAFLDVLRELSNGTASVEIVETNEAAIVPLGELGTSPSGVDADEQNSP